MDIKHRFWILFYFSFVSGHLTQSIDKSTEISPQHLERFLRRLLHKMDSAGQIGDTDSRVLYGSDALNSGEDISRFVGGDSNSVNDVDREKFREAKVLTKIFLPDDSHTTLSSGNGGDLGGHLPPYRSAPGLRHDGKMRLAKMLMSLVKVSPVSPGKKSMPDFNPTGW